MDEKDRSKQEEDVEVPKEPNDTDEQKQVNTKDLLQKIAEIDDKYKRALADYQNLQRRSNEEKLEWVRSANKEFILKILPVLDTLMLAQKHTEDKNFVLTVAQFLQVLEQEGVTRIKTIGEEFNPHTMEAVSTTDVKEEKNKVIEETRAGYIYYDLVIRPAQVIVGK